MVSVSLNLGRRDAGCGHPALRLRYVHPTYRSGDVLPGQWLGLAGRPVLPAVRFELGDADAIDAGRAFVLGHFPPPGKCALPGTPRKSRARGAASIIAFARSAATQWNCSSSVEPVSAVTDELPPWMTVVTSSKYPVPTSCWCETKV